MNSVARTLRRLPREVENLVNRALVAELAVTGGSGPPVVHPLIPLYDGSRIYMTSSVLFSKKLERIKLDPRVAVSFTDSDAVSRSGIDSATIQGDAEVIEDDLHSGWMSLLPLWRQKEPVIDKFVRQRFAMPLFWERAIIRIRPRRVLVWVAPGREPEVFDIEDRTGGGG